MHRPTVGVLAIVLLLAGGVMYFAGYDEGNALLLQAAFLRVGAVLATLWIAHPELSRMRPWMVILFVAALVGVVFVRRLLVPLLVVALLIAILRPRAPRGTKKN
jgi:Ni,Fe-hydrogenase I cytochrome b subunit